MEELKPVAEEAGRNAAEAVEKAIETAKPVVNEAISETMDFIKEVKEDTKPE